MMRLKTSIIMLFICITAVLFSTAAVNADMSPKPSLTIIPDSFPSNSYIAVLSTDDEPGYQMWHVDETWFDMTENKWFASKASDEINRQFYEYVKNNYEKNGWYLWGNIVSGQYELVFKTVRPSHFRILVYLADENKFIVSDQEYKCSVFDYTVNIRYQNEELITDSIYNSNSIGRIVLRTGITIAIELAAGFFFLKKKGYKNLLTIISVNFLTQLILHVLMYTVLSSVFSSAVMYYPILIILEVMIIFTEGFIYSRKIRRQDLPHPYYFSVFANILSFAAGLIVAI